MEENCKRSQGSQRAVVLLKKKNDYACESWIVKIKGKLNENIEKRKILQEKRFNWK